MRGVVAFLLLLSGLGCGSRQCREEARVPQAAGISRAEREAGEVPSEPGAGDGSAAAAEDLSPSAGQGDGSDALGEEYDDWSSGPERRRVVVQAAGDYILHSRVHNSARFHADRTDDPDIAATEGYSYLIYRVKPVLARGDLNLVNLETPLATERFPQSADPPIFNGPPAAALSLARTGFHVVSVANNHAYDQGREGVVETRRTAEDAGLLVVGGGADGDQARAPLFVVRHGVRIGILAFTENVNRTSLVAGTRPTMPQVAIWRGEPDLETVRSVRRQCDLLVVMFHWGDEYQMVPNRFQRGAAAALCEAGVDLIVGSHTHTLQEVRRFEGPDEGECVVAYSLGNFLSNQGLKYRLGRWNAASDRYEGNPYTRDSAILRVTWEEDLEGRLQVAAVEAVPLWTENNWLDRFRTRNFRNDIFVAPIAVLMGDPDRAGRYRALYAERLAEIARSLGDEVTLVDL